MKSLQLLIVAQILGFSCSLPVIHNPLTKMHDSRIYFQNAVSPYGKFGSSVHEFNTMKNVDRFLHLGTYGYDDYNHHNDMDERIHFPVPNAEEIVSRQLLSESDRDSDAILFEPEFPQTRFRHALALDSPIEDIASSTVQPPKENPPTKKESAHEQADEVQSPVTTVPLSFLEQWAKQHSTMPVAESVDDHRQKAAVDESAIVFDNGETKEGQDKSFSFQSFLQLPRLTSTARLGEGDCPPNQVRNHRGKCVKPIRIIVFEADPEETEER